MPCNDYQFLEGKHICQIHLRHEGTPMTLAPGRVSTYCMHDNPACPEKCVYPEESPSGPAIMDNRPGTLGYIMDQAGL